MPAQRGPVPVPSHKGDRDLTQEILDLLDSKGTFSTEEAFPDVSQPVIKAALDRLGSKSMIEYDTKDTDKLILTPEAESICDNGSHEFRVWEAVVKNGKLGLKELPDIVGGADSAKVGQGTAFRNKWIKKEGDSLVPVAKEVKDSTRLLLQGIRETQSLDDAKVLADLRKRKLVTVGKVFKYTVRKGPNFATKMPVEAVDLTADMLASGEWKTTTFKPYNFDALGASQRAGALHPLQKVRTELRNLFFSQGFTEMPTARFCESGFWNFDALYVPQQHPARDVQDTFYISFPEKADKPRHDPQGEKAMEEMEASSRRLLTSGGEQRNAKSRDYEKYFRSIKEVHQDGAFASAGYRYPWSEEECLRLVLRTHTTAVSAWALHRLAEDPRPARYFSIDRVFRNEAVDATHLAEFFQVEGVIADFGLTLGGLMKFFESFFYSMGIENLRFKPAYNPYTEPSMEIFAYHKGLNRVIEIGNSGMFRPEMLLPMGLPKDMRVYGFGLSLERPTMIKYGLRNIRELVGHKIDLGFVESNAAVRLEKN